MTVAAPVTRAGRLSGLRGPVLVGAAGLAAAALLHLRDPHSSGTYGSCPFLVVTGLPCPGCGGLRAVNDLTRGDVVAALSSNALAVATVLGLAVAWAVWLVRRARGRRVPMMSLTSITFRRGAVVLGVIVLFGVLRVTPVGSWLAP